MRKIWIFLLLLNISIVHAEINYTINTSSYNSSAPVTGLFGYTVDFCNNDAECFGYKCFVDFDNLSGQTGKQGWCNATSITSCYSAGTTIFSGILPTATASGVCTSNTTYRTCTSGAWSAATSCSSGQTCSGNGTCSTPSTTTTTTTGGGGGAGTNVTTTKKASVEVTAAITDFEIVQGDNATKSVTVRNNGDLILGNVLLELTGISWYTIIPTSFSRINVSGSATYTVSFSPLNDTEVKLYTVQAKVTTNYTAANASFTFNIKVLPTNETVEREILPKYDEYLKLIDEYEKNITTLEKEGYNMSDVKGILNTLKSKIQGVNQSITDKDYFSASTQLDEMKTLLDELNTNLAKLTKPEQKIDIIIYIIIGIVIVLILVIAYLFWPTKQSPFAKKPLPGF